MEEEEEEEEEERRTTRTRGKKRCTRGRAWIKRQYTSKMDFRMTWDQ